MRFHLIVQGVDKVTKSIGGKADRARKQFVAQARFEAEKIRTESLKQCPIEFSNLRNSAFLDGTEDRNGIRCIIGYRSEYAAAVHNIPAPPAQSEGGLSATHEAPTKWRYLIDPLNAAREGFIQRVEDGVVAELSK